MVRPVSSCSFSTASAVGMVPLVVKDFLVRIARLLSRLAGEAAPWRPLRPGPALRFCIAHAQIFVETRLPESTSGVAYKLHFRCPRPVAELSTGEGPAPQISDSGV